MMTITAPTVYGGCSLAKPLLGTGDLWRLGLRLRLPRGETVIHAEITAPEYSETCLQTEIAAPERSETCFQTEITAPEPSGVSS
jgi:hypothetical protein